MGKKVKKKRAKDLLARIMSGASLLLAFAAVYVPYWQNEKMNSEKITAQFIKPLHFEQIGFLRKSYMSVLPDSFCCEVGLPYEFRVSNIGNVTTSIVDIIVTSHVNDGFKQNIFLDGVNFYEGTSVVKYPIRIE